MTRPTLRCFAMDSTLFVLTAVLLGCSGADPAPPAEASDTQKQQIQEYKQQATDEWGNKVK